LVGPSGSGKSTIVQLIERFYDPHSGRILIDGEDLKNVSLRDFRSKVGYVGQEPVLFNQTIRENLRYGKPDATDEEMMYALKMANASKIIAKLPDGLETMVGAQGGQLSGGEKQRIALARAFIKNPKVLILDEATSALDRANEEEVQDAIDNLKNGDHGITTIVIAHRLATIRYSDKIIVLKDGKVAEEGNHEYLLKTFPEGVYSTLVSKQEQLDEEYDRENQDSFKGSYEEDSDNGDTSEIEKESMKVSKVVKSKKRRRLTSKKHTSFAEELKNKKEQADQIDEESKNEKEELYKSIAKRGYFKRLMKYNRPYWLIAIGLVVSAIQGMTMPLFGFFYVKILFAMFDDDIEQIGMF
jgi:ATP-binding cassette subfamily B (MDR/TAP) protein 1